MISSDNWKTINGSEKKRRFHGIATVDDLLLIIGGYEKDVVTGKNEIFNSKTKQWQLKSPLTTPRE